MDHMAGQDYAAACHPEPGRCFRLVYDEQGKPTQCARRPIEAGMLKLGERWYQAEACFKHRGELRFRGPLVAPGRPPL